MSIPSSIAKIFGGGKSAAPQLIAPQLIQPPAPPDTAAADKAAQEELLRKRTLMRAQGRESTILNTFETQPIAATTARPSLLGS